MATSFRIRPVQKFTSVEVPEDFKLPASFKNVPVITRGDLARGNGEILDRIRQGKPFLMGIHGLKDEGVLGWAMIFPGDSLTPPETEDLTF